MGEDGRKGSLKSGRVSGTGQFFLRQYSPFSSLPPSSTPASTPLPGPHLPQTPAPINNPREELFSRDYGVSRMDELFFF
jgi:hypothetical protein